nr:hypothetical protein [Kofleriaceae bacterium]
MPRLYSYCLPYDDGAAPNPFHGVCTLVICKPRIRATAKEGDWIVGTGAMHARRADGSSQDMSGKLIYAMRVSRRMSMSDYDRHTRKHLPGKIPASTRDRGDSIYDFSGAEVVQRPGPHAAGNIKTDLGGKNALLSDHFYYFGDAALDLPAHLLAIAQNRQGHRVKLNEPHVGTFIEWMEGLGHAPCSILGAPLMAAGDDQCRRWCASCRADDDDQDMEILTQAPC